MTSTQKALQPFQPGTPVDFSSADAAKRTLLFTLHTLEHPLQPTSGVEPVPQTVNNQASPAEEEEEEENDDEEPAETVPSKTEAVPEENTPPKQRVALPEAGRSTQTKTQPPLTKSDNEKPAKKKKNVSLLAVAACGVACAAGVVGLLRRH